MANALNKDQFILDYNKQRLSFIEALKRFSLHKGTPFDRLPEIGGQEVDLYHLYQKVTSYGGWHKVNNDQLWERIVSDFWLPNACTNAVEVLKHIYFRYLNLYEKVNFLGEEVDLRKNDDEDGPTRKKICLPIESIPLNYNYNQHRLTDAQRQQHNLPTDLLKRNPYEKIELSLQSGFPNEVDHAVNVCVLLSTEGRHTINLNKVTRLIELLLAHIGVFDDEFGLEDLYASCWAKHTGRDFLRFWYESVKKKEIRSLITYKGHVYSQREMAGEDVLNLGRDIGIGDVEGQRVLQMGVFIRNLSFEECNQKLLASNCAVFKFLILCLHNTYGNLRQIALDTLANLANELSLVSTEDLGTQIILDFLHESLVSEDRFCLVRGMEVLGKICLKPSNEGLLSTHIREEVYRRLVDLLTIQDIQIIVHSLEALYKLSKAGEPFTTMIARVHKAIDILVSLITIEAQSFGPGSLVGIKVVEYVPPVSEDDREMVKRPTTVIQPVNPDCINIYQIPSSQLSQMGQSELKAGNNSAVAKAREPVTDIQATSTSWLKATYEAKKRSKVNQVELFSEYLQFCRKFGIKNTLSSADFLQMVKTIFDQVEVLSINRKNGDKDVFFEGLCKRTTQLPFAVTTVQKDKVDKPVSVNVSPQQTPSSHVVTPTLRQRLMEPLRHSLQHQLLHTGGATNPATPKTSGNFPNSAALRMKSPVTQILNNGKPGRVIVTTPLAKGKRKPEGLVTPQIQPSANQPVISKAGDYSQHFVQNGPTTDATNAMSSDGSCVKSLLAKKLCQVNSESTPFDLNSSVVNHQNSYNNTVTSQPFNTSKLQPGTFVVCPAVTSSPMNPSHRPAYQQGKTSVTSDIWCNKPAGKPLPSQATAPPSQIVSTVPSSHSSESHTNTSQSSSSLASQPAMLNSHINQPLAVAPSISSANESFVNAQISNANSLPTVGIKNTTGFVSDSASLSQNCLQNGVGQQQNTSFSVVQPNTRLINTSTTASVAPQAQQLTVQTIQQSLQHLNNNVVTTPSLSNSGVAVMQQGANISVIPQPQTITQQNLTVSGANLSLQGSNLITVGHQNPGIVQQQQSMSQTNTSIPLNQLIHPSSNVQVAGQQQPVLPSNIVSIATVTQSISSPAVAAMLSSSSQSVHGQGQSQVVISTPLQQASTNRPAVGVPGVPSSVVIQTQPGTIVMPSRQVVLQGNVGTVGAVQQRAVGQQAGTVSFVVPQYRQTSSLIIQQSGAVNVLPSLALQTQQAIAQPNPAAQTLTGQMSTPLGPRQIVINQSQLPVGMQISSLPGNGGGICVAPQQQPQQPANIVIQPNTILSQPSPPTNLQLNVNGTQVVRNESLSRSDVVTNVNHTQILQQQEQQAQSQISQQQQQNQLPNSQLVIQTSQQAQHQLPVTSLQCNGGSHEVNGVLGSPDSMSSDLPPSPQSTGLQSDMLNGQLSDSDSGKSDLAKLVDKSGRPKINGIIHNFENGCYTNIQQPPPKISPTSPVLPNSSHANKMDIPSQVTNNSQIRVVNGTGMPVNSLSQQSVIGNEPGNPPQKIIVNVVQHQQSRVAQVGNGSNINGLNQQQQQVNFVSQQQQSGNVVFQQQQPANTVLHQQGQIIGAPTQQQQSKNTIFQRVVVNNVVQQQQQSGTIMGQQQQQIVKPGMQQPQKPSNSVSTVPANQTSPSISRPQTRISTLPCPSPAPPPTSSKVTNTTNLSQQRTVISRSSCDNDTDSVTDANKIARPGQATQTNVATPAPKRKAAIVAMVDKTPIRLRRKKENDTGATEGQSQTPVSIVLEYKCEWGTCRRNFPSARQVFLHVFRHHIPKTKESFCQWFTCEKMVRKRWSLVSHVQDYHCSEMAMRSACHRRFTMSQNPSAPPPPPPPQPMVYPPDAAAQAIRRFAIKPPYPEFAEQREGPVSKHIRLTAALILRNICHQSALGRKLISRHEKQLNYNCMSMLESSTALSSCLWDIIHFGEAQYKSTTTASHFS